MLGVGLVLVLVLLAIAVLLFHGIAIYLALQMPRLDPLPPGAQLPEPPSIGVVVVARNEEEDLAVLLDSLLAQEYPGLEIVVVDGGSTDRSRDVARARAPGIRLMEEPPLPDGWVGKNWACEVGQAAVGGEWLLFLDADVWLHPHALRTTMDWALRERADLATLAPHIEMRGFWERVVLPFYTQMVLTYFRAPRINVDGSRAAMANGQFLLVRRSSYEAAGRHAAVRGFVLEDVVLARRFRSLGYRLRIAFAPLLATTRMYRNRTELFEGLLKNVHGPRFSAARQVGFLAALVGFFWLPLAVLPFGLVDGSAAVVALGAVLLVALFGKHAAFSRAVGNGRAYGLLFPVAVGFYVVLVGASIVRGLQRRPIMWKGRAYPIRPSGNADRR